ncbi:sugar-binding protein [Maribacter thermophilus]|uniref:sugar-binding protein n=1 Tax=Maribacter thermophilus TaxID=1197874 RepID=UPI00064126FD|nr:sugar-binding protein [Maribacter thermophilus]
MKSIVAMALILVLLSCNKHKEKQDSGVIKVDYTEKAPLLDGKPTETFWNLCDWLPLDQNWIGGPYEHGDFNGRYKLAWNEEALYILIEITDDILLDRTEDPLKLWWNDDCVEIFIDEDNSGGLHQFSHNAFAYHVALDGNVVDLGPDKKPRLYNDHVSSAHTTEDNLTTWELAVKVFDDSFMDGTQNTPVSLKPGKKIGFALAYCDNDKSTERENFIGSVFVEGEDKNQGWINADIFGTLLLSK